MAFGVSYAQYVTDYLKAADKYYNKSDYYSAAQYYEKYLNTLSKGKESGYDPYAVQALARKAGLSENRSEQVVYQIAECYKALNYYSKAEPYYSQAVSFSKTQYPLASYGYGLILRSLGKYEEAEKAITSFLAGYTAQDRYKVAAEQELANLQYIRQQLQKNDADLYKVSKAATPLNMPGANYAPVLNNGMLVFTSTRTDSTGKRVPNLNRLYQASFSNGTLDSIARLALPESPDHQGTAAMSADGNTLFFSGWQHKDNKRSAAIYTSKRNGAGWDAPVSMNINITGSNTQQPFVTSDGSMLLFASDRAGGQGGFDLYAATLDAAGKAGEPVNMGKTINTAGDEQAPYYHAASGTLVFASTGRVGMGGYDLFFSKGTLAATAVWTAPENFGYPVNSAKDDLYFASAGGKDNLLESVWISSDRTAECCLELFSLSKQLPPPVVVKTEEPVVTDTAITLPEPGVAEVLKNVYYAYNKSDLLKGSYAPLDKLVTLLKENKDIVIEVGGHTDSKGSDAYNEKLSMARAQKCVDYIISKGISRDRVIAKGYGSKDPVAANTNADGTDNPEGRQLNRTTTFTIVK
jgi:outer membrane protein OmpA-like peptidoglycan-associated protein